MSNLIPVEFKNQRIITTKDLAEAYGATEKNIQDNYLNNKDRFIHGKDYFKLEGQSLKEFKNSLPDNIGEPLKYAPSLTLWTEKGAARHAKILDTDEAWEVYEQLEETYFKVKEQSVLLNQLSPELQLFNSLFKALANNEIEQKRLAQEIAVTKEEVAAVREVIEIVPSNSWRNETNTLVKKICTKAGDYKTPKEEIYKALSQRAACDLKRRLENMRARLILNGGSKSKADALNYLDVIADDKKLVEIYTSIVKEMAIKHKIA